MWLVVMTTTLHSKYSHTLTTPGSCPSLHTGTQAMCRKKSNGLRDDLINWKMDKTMLITNQVVLKCVLMVSGGQCVMKDGMKLMPEWHVDNSLRELLHKVPVS